MQITQQRRRSMLKAIGAVITAGGNLGVLAQLVRSNPAMADDLSLNLMSLSNGTVGAVWQPLVERQPEAKRLKIGWTGGDPGQVQMQLLAGAVDVTALGPIGAGTSALKGGDLTIFAPLLYNHGSIFVKGNSPYRTLKDLKGKTIATYPQTTDTTRQLYMAASMLNIDLKKDYKVIHSAALANQALFDRGDVEAIVISEPFATRIVAKGAREVVRLSDMWIEGTGDKYPAMLNGLGARLSWLQTHKEIAATVFKLYQTVNRQINENPGMLEELHDYLGIRANETDVIKLLPSRMGRVFSSDWGPETFKNIDMQVDLAVKLGIFPKKPGRKLYEQVAQQ